MKINNTFEALNFKRKCVTDSNNLVLLFLQDDVSGKTNNVVSYCSALMPAIWMVVDFYSNRLKATL